MDDRIDQEARILLLMLLLPAAAAAATCRVTPHGALTPQCLTLVNAHITNCTDEMALFTDQSIPITDAATTLELRRSAEDDQLRPPTTAYVACPKWCPDALPSLDGIVNVAVYPRIKTERPSPPPKLVSETLGFARGLLPYGYNIWEVERMSRMTTNYSCYIKADFGGVDVDVPLPILTYGPLVFVDEDEHVVYPVNDSGPETTSPPTDSTTQSPTTSAALTTATHDVFSTPSSVCGSDPKCKSRSLKMSCMRHIVDVAIFIDDIPHPDSVAYRLKDHPDTMIVMCPVWCREGLGYASLPRTDPLFIEVIPDPITSHGVKYTEVITRHRNKQHVYTLRNTHTFTGDFPFGYNEWLVYGVPLTVSVVECVVRGTNLPAHVVSVAHVSESLSSSPLEIDLRIEQLAKQWRSDMSDAHTDLPQKDTIPVSAPTTTTAAPYPCALIDTYNGCWKHAAERVNMCHSRLTHNPLIGRLPVQMTDVFRIPEEKDYVVMMCPNWCSIHPFVHTTLEMRVVPYVQMGSTLKFVPASPARMATTFSTPRYAPQPHTYPAFLGYTPTGVFPFGYTQWIVRVGLSATSVSCELEAVYKGPQGGIDVRRQATVTVGPINTTWAHSPDEALAAVRDLKDSAHDHETPPPHRPTG